MKFVQIAATSVGAGNAVLFALDDTGTLWKKIINPSDNPGRAWIKVPPPGDEQIQDDDSAAPMPFIA